jgi:hypothetical protein
LFQGWPSNPAKARDLLVQPMNLLIVGRDKTDAILEHLSGQFLLLDDGPIIDEWLLRNTRKSTELDFTKHSFNPLSRMDSKRARDFISILDAIFPEGENTLTKKNSNHVLLKALREKPRNFLHLLTKLTPPKASDTAYVDAYQKIENLLLSDVLEHVFTNPTNFSSRGVLLARLDRAELSEFVCRVLGLFLVAGYKGQVVIPDFGFYGARHHTGLMREDRLIAGVNWLDEIPDLRHSLLLIDDKIGRHTTAEDAEALAEYTGLVPNTNAHSEFVQRAIQG